MQGVPHPINDPLMVSYHRPEVVRILPSLELASDCWYQLDGTFVDGKGVSKDLKAKYLHQEDGEPNRAYGGRRQDLRMHLFIEIALEHMQDC